MKKCFYAWVLIMPLMVVTAVTPPADIKSPGEIAAENFVRQLPALWAHGTEAELFDITTNAVDAILSNKDAEKRDLAFTYCADAVAALEVESRNDEDYDRSLDMRGYLIETMLRYSGKTDVGILLSIDCRVKFYETLKRESEKYPVVKLPRFVDDLRTTMADKYGITNNIRYVSKDGFTPEGIARRRKEMNEIARAVSKRRKRAEYGECVQREIKREEENYYDNALKYYYGKLSGECNTNILEKVHATIGRYPKWYSPQ